MRDSLFVQNIGGNGKTNTKCVSTEAEMQINMTVN